MQTKNVDFYGGPQLSRQNTIHQGKIKFVTAKYNPKQQIQITPVKLQTLTAKTKTIIAIQNSTQQEQNTHGIFKFIHQAQILWELQHYYDSMRCK